MESINPVASTMAQLILSRIIHSQSIAQVRAIRSRVIAAAIIGLRSQRVRIDTLRIAEVRVHRADTSRTPKLPIEEAFYLDSINTTLGDASSQALSVLLIEASRRGSLTFFDNRLLVAGTSFSG